MIFCKIFCCLSFRNYLITETYNNGLKVATEKSAQTCNTSSADDQLDKVNFRRKHPVMALSTKKNFEYIFNDPKSKHAESIASDFATPLAEKQRQLKTARVQKPKTNLMEKNRKMEELNEQVQEKDRETVNLVSLSKSRSVSVDKRPALHSPRLEEQFDSRSSHHSTSRRSRTRSRSGHSSRSLSHNSSRSQSNYSGSRHSRPCSKSKTSKSDSSPLRSISQQRSSSSGGRSIHSIIQSHSSGSNKSSPRYRNPPQQQNSQPASSQQSFYSRSRSSSRSSMPDQQHQHSREQLPRQSRRAARRCRSPSRNSYETSRVEHSIGALDRRMTRIEVTVNKVFVMVGDLIKHANKSQPSRNERRLNSPSFDRRIPKRFVEPEFPIYSVSKLAVFSKMIKKKEIYDFMVSYTCNIFDS